MTQSLRPIKVFLSSPSDVRRERDVVANAIETFNKSIGPILSVHIKLLRWETHAVPDFDGGGPQRVIGRVYEEERPDVFILLLWRRFGTPTPGFGSGTEEEFRWAVKQRERHGSRPRIMVYVKDDPSDSDATARHQCSKLQEFLAELRKMTLHDTFRSDVELFLKLSRHLIASLPELLGKGSCGSTISDDTSKGGLHLPQTTRRLLFQTMDGVEGRLKELRRITERLDSQAAKHWSRLTECVRAFVSLDSNASLRERQVRERKMTRNLETAMKDYVDVARPDLGQFRQLMRAVFGEAAMFFVLFFLSWDKENLLWDKEDTANRYRRIVGEFVTQLSRTRVDLFRDSVGDMFRDTVGDLQARTQSLHQAKTELDDVLGEQIRAFAEGRRLGHEFLRDWPV